ncbi:MAG: hypothetical protein H6Q08_2788 [Acidobacteria bacterium]|nr:hypothetical protein [Acidobacteriota bacterium]
MKRTHIIGVALACGWLSTSIPVFAQEAPAPAPAVDTNWFTGTASFLLLGRDDVSSSKFEEYRTVPKGVSMPLFSVQGSQNGMDFGLFAQKVSLDDQRYFGYANVGWLGVKFDYNQIPHSMGNDGQVIHAETGEGVWNMSATLRKSLGDAVDAVLPATARTYPFYANLLAPTIASAGSVDVSDLRKRGDVGFDLPFGLAVTYMREVKTGYRGASGGDILGTVTSAVDVAEPLNELTQDFGIRWASNFKIGNAYASFNRNVYNDRVDSLIIDNPFRATDLAYTSTAVPGGPAQARFSTSPDNEANRFALGGQIKLARQTRIGADLAFQTMTQDAAFLPFTINSAIFTPAGIQATNPSLLPAQSLDGQIDTTTFNVSFVSRPINPLWIRMRYRSYDLENKTTPISWTGGSTSGSPDRSWGAESATEGAPYGYATANLYDNSNQRFDAQVGFDIGALTLEGAYRYASLERTWREATSGDENGYSIAAVFHAMDWLGFRGMFGQLKRTADGETLYGFQADEAERETTRAGLELELTPFNALGFTFSYAHWNHDYPNRPDRIAVSGGVPVPGAQPIPGTPSGLLEASYDTYTVEVDYTPSERTEVGGYYTYEKNESTNQFSTTTGVNLNNLLNYAGSDRGDTFGAYAMFQFVPDKWKFSLRLSRQEVDGLMDVTAREAGTFYTPGRTTVIPPGTGGAQDITDFDDTELTTFITDLAYTFAKAWTWSVGYAYEKYDHADAFSDGTTMFPQSVLFFMKADDGPYEANIGYTRLIYRF